MTPTNESPRSCWQWHVSAGATREERAARLDQCPEEFREEVRRWVVRFFEDLQQIKAARVKQHPDGITHHDQES